MSWHNRWLELSQLSAVDGIRPKALLRPDDGGWFRAHRRTVMRLFSVSVSTYSASPDDPMVVAFM